MRLAVPASGVREILPLPHLRRPPAAPAPFAGFVDLGGRALPVIDLAALFGVEAGGDPVWAHLLLVALDGSPVALRVDRVEDVVSLDPVEATAVEGSATLNGCITAALPIRGALVPLLDPDRLLTAAERSALDGLVRLERERAARWAET